MRKLFALVFAIVVGAGAVSAQSELPVRKVVLYKNGVGYFEHVGKVSGNQAVEVSFTSAQLDDVLKSLTVLDLGQGRVTSVSYESAAPLERQLGEISISLAGKASVAEFLNQIRGASVEIRMAPGVVTGRLLGVEKRAVLRDGNRMDVDEVSIFAESGEVHTVDLQQVGGVRITDKNLASDVNRYLELLFSSHRRDVRRLSIEARGSGERQLYVSYTSEVPIWKTNYRLVLDPKRKPLLQGWAIVDNTTAEDWRNVELALVAGAPISFIQKISQPYYSRRPVVPLPQGVQVTPQTHEATLEALPATAAAAEMALEEKAEGNASRRQMAAKSGLVGGMPGGVIGGLIGEVRREQEAVAQGGQLGELFEYQIRQPVTILQNRSALIPIVQTEIGAEKVSLYNEATAMTGRPFDAVWLENTSGLTLDGGSFVVLEDEAFAGEGLSETIKPGEKRLLSYGVDLSTLIDTKRESTSERVDRVRIHRGVLVLYSKQVERKTYTIRNSDARSRIVVIEHPVRGGWKLVKTAEPAESSANFYRFRVEAKPRETTQFSVSEEMPIETTYQLTNLTPDLIAQFVRQRYINPTVERALARIVAKKDEVAALDGQIKEREAEVEQIFKDQERLRNNIKALGRSPEERALVLRYTRQLEQEETRLDAVRSETAALRKKRQAAQEALEQMMKELALDENV